LILFRGSQKTDSAGTIGLVGGIAVLLVVHSEREQHGEEKIRIISARKASLRERALYDSHQ
jgi:uncharacterized DUF497 family protein